MMMMVADGGIVHLSMKNMLNIAVKCPTVNISSTHFRHVSKVRVRMAVSWMGQGVGLKNKTINSHTHTHAHTLCVCLVECVRV